MQPCLLLAMALLGTAAASRPAPATPAAQETALEVPQEEPRCPLESETRVLSIPDPLGATTCRYTIVTRYQSFYNAQRTCARCYGGRLISFSSYRVNICLQRQAQLCTNGGQIWIAPTSGPESKAPRCRWEDRRPWEFSSQLHRYALRFCRYCTAVYTNSGCRRSLPCQTQLPFICEY